MDCKCVAFSFPRSSFDPSKADLLVAQDGTGKYRTISEALKASQNMRTGTKRFVIYVKARTYREYVVVEKSMINITPIGDGIDSTVVTGNKNHKDDGLGPFLSATVIIEGDGFAAKEMTFENTARPEKLAD